MEGETIEIGSCPTCGAVAQCIRADNAESGWPEWRHVRPSAFARPSRYFADGPQGAFWGDDLELMRALVSAYDKSDDWTITDLLDRGGL